jgi:SAM-dependent methyltransferase
MPSGVSPSCPEAAQRVNTESDTLNDLPRLDEQISGALKAHQRVNQLTLQSPLSPGFWLQKITRRCLAWYTLPIQLFQQSTVVALQDVAILLRGIIAGYSSNIQQLQERQDAMAQEHVLLLEKFDLFRRVVQMTTTPKLLRENDRVVEYWNRAAEIDPVRETVTQQADETNEQYQENWKKIGDYVAAKIMSYSVANPVALEIGPGMGRITVPMSRYCKSITALDISPVMAARAQEALAFLNNVEIQIITDEDLRFLPGDHFDLAYSIACFQHADKKTLYRYLEGVRRALKAGGVLFFGVLDLCTDRGWGHFEAIVRNDYPQFFHTQDEVACYLRHAGYSSYEFMTESETLWTIARR